MYHCNIWLILKQDVFNWFFFGTSNCQLVAVSCIAVYCGQQLSVVDCFKGYMMF